MATGKKIGARIVLDGEAEFRQSINNSKSALKAFDSELKLTQTQFKNNEKSLSALKKTQEVYLKQQKELQKQEKSYVEQLKKASEAHKDAKKAQEETAKTIDKLNKELDDAKKQYGENSKEVEELNKELEKSENEYKKQGTAIGTLEGKMSKWEQGLNETRTQLVEVDRNLEETNDNIENFGESMDDVAESTGKANPELSELSVSMGKLVTADLIADGIRRLASAVVDLAKSAIDVGMEFESSMSKVAALSGATGEEYDRLADKAREMGATTMYSASEAADAFSYMALAGWDTKQMLEGIEPVLSLAAASNMDLAEASDIVTDYLTAFGLEAKDAAKFTDQLAYAMANSNTDVTQLGEAYKSCAAAAGSMGYSVEDVTAALMTMANAGVKGGEAGTSLRSIMINLATNTNHCADALEEFGVEIYDLETGEMNSLSDILIQTASAFDGLSDSEANSLAKTIAGKTQFTGFETILLGLNDAAKQSGKSFEDYAEALKSCDGYASDMANTMQNNLQGKLTILESSLQALGESAYDVFKEDLKDGVDVATEAVSRLNESVKKGDLNTSLKRISGSVNELIDKVADWVETTLPDIINGLANIIDNADKIAPILEGIVAGFIAFKSITTLATLVSSVNQLKVALELASIEQLKLNMAADSNPYVLLASVILGVGVAVYEWTKNNKTLTEEWTEESKKIARGYEETAKKFSDFANESNEYINTLKAESSYISDLVKELDAYNKKASLSADERKRVSEIVGILNGKFKDLNLQIDSETGKLTDNTNAWKKNIEEQLQIAKVEAIQTRLTEAYEKQLDAQVNLREQEEKLAAIEKEHGSELKELEYLYSGNADATQENIDRMNELENSLSSVIPEYLALKDGVDSAKTSVDESSASIDNLNNFLNENTVAIEENANATTESSNTVIDSTNKMSEAWYELRDAAEKSISSQVGLFDELTLKVEGGVKGMSDAIGSQADVFKTYAEDLKTASELANNSTDPNFKAIVANIESMGIDGAGYLHELVNAAESDTEEFNKLMENWAAMEDAKSTLVDTMATFEDDFTTGTDNLKDLQQTFKEDTENSTTELTENVKETVATANEEIQQNVDESLLGYETSLENAVPIVKADAENLANTTKDSITNIINYEVFFHLGEEVGNGLAEGIRSKIDEVRTAAEELAQAAESASKDKLKVNSPSKVFIGIGESVGEGFEKGIERSMKGTVSKINSMMPNESNIEVSSIQSVNLGANTEGNGTLSRINGLLNEYLPTLASLKVVMDTGRLVGALSGPMNQEFGRIAQREKIK